MCCLGSPRELKPWLPAWRRGHDALRRRDTRGISKIQWSKSLASWLIIWDASTLQFCNFKIKSVLNEYTCLANSPLRRGWFFNIGLSCKDMRKYYIAHIEDWGRWYSLLFIFEMERKFPRLSPAWNFFASCGQVWMKEYFITPSKLLILLELLCHISPPHSILKTKDTGYSYFILNLLVLKVIQIKFSFWFNWVVIMLIKCTPINY